MASDDFLKPDSDKNTVASSIENKLLPFERALADLLVWREGSDGSGEWRVRLHYRDLFACLTPRQIKSFLRERLLASMGKGESDDPEIGILKTLFHPVWKLWRDENATFRGLRHVARAALMLSKESRGDIDKRGKLSGPAAELFYLQLQAAARKSTVLTEDDVRACWPRKSEERALLLNLLAITADEEIVSGESFADWVLRHFGVRPNGTRAAEQVSAFQDIALERHQKGDEAAQQAVTDYVDLFLDRHMKSFDASAASTLSNLAVLVSDVAGAEAQCDRLFRAAVKLARPGSRIPFYYVEFLLDALEDPARRERLPVQDVEGRDPGQRAQAILAAIRDEDMEAKDRFYRDILAYRFSAGRSEDRQERMTGVWALTKKNAGTLLSGSSEPSSRLNDLLDAVIGKRGASLRLKEPLQGMVWAAQVRAGRPGWPMLSQIANDLIGESETQAEEEKTGLRLNATLVANVELLAADEGRRLAAIWSQTGSLLAQRQGTQARGRIALAFLASLVHGSEAQSLERMRQAWARLGLGGVVVRTPSDWVQFLDEAHRPLAEALMQGTHDAETMVMVRDAVFGADYPPIVTPDGLAEAMGWKSQAFAWADGKSFDEAVTELVEDADDVN